MSISHAIGGYLELETSPGQGEYHRKALRLQSARAGLYALLQSGKPDAVWMPWYICDSMLAPLRLLGIPFRFYSINRLLDVEADIIPAAGEWLVYVNYFGLCQSHAERLAQRMPRGALIIDHSQAFFAPPIDCLANIYSPRKFFGVPDGGYLLTSLELTPLTEQDTGSVGRCRHLLQRLNGAAEAGYADYVVAEASLSNLTPLRMSTLTRRLLDCIDYVGVMQRRRKNFFYLAKHLGKRNEFRLPLDERAVPLCYPFLRGNGSQARRRADMLQQRIYLPAYWPEVAERSGAPPFEASLSETCLFLPCDQHLQEEDLDHIISLLLE
jgi:hypothetical protein